MCIRDRNQRSLRSAMSSFLSTSSVRHRSSTEAPSSLSINGTIISMRLSLAATLSMLTSQGPEHALQALMHHRHQFRRGYNASVCPEPQDPVYELLRVADLVGDIQGPVFQPLARDDTGAAAFEGEREPRCERHLGRDLFFTRTRPFPPGLLLKVEIRRDIEIRGAWRFLAHPDLRCDPVELEAPYLSPDAAPPDQVPEAAPAEQAVRLDFTLQGLARAKGPVGERKYLPPYQGVQDGIE